MKIMKFSFLLGMMLIFTTCGENNAPQQNIPKISVFETIAEDVPVYLEFVGTIAGQKDIAIRARVQGFLEGIHFGEGLMVKRDRLLYSIESQQYEAEYAAMLSKVAEAKTMLVKADADLNRTRPLAANNAVSQSDLDAAVASFKAAEASVEAAKANLRAANIQLSYTNVKAPISGLIGKTRAKVGDFVGLSPNPVILNVVSKIDTVLVDFFLTENQYLAFVKRLTLEEENLIKGKKIAEEKVERTFELILADGSVHEYKGKANFVDREIDPMTGAILIQVSFPNPDKTLRPGQFAKVRALDQVKKDAILIPQRCISELQGQYSVLVVDSENKVERRKVTATEKIGSMWLIEDGLRPSEKIIYEGLQKVKVGMTVQPVPAENKTIIEEN